MKTKTLYRPVGLKELELIEASNFTKFPPRLLWQPIFYPVLNEAYAIEIATKWNLDDEGSGYSGFVTAFDVDADYITNFKVENVGGPIHNELWIPAEELEIFNAHIIGEIKIIKMYLGSQFQYPENEMLKSLIKDHETKHKIL
ncbi:ADP-ribosylation/crystallin J1 [Dokdonia sp.]|uniref:ADP-ribosylation/crystallin J1 n=1 Tax=Dokdonia sp. TaxID=2024995 RepID=UPI003263A70F